DGFENHYLEWYGARPIEWTALAAGSTMQRAKRPIEALRFGVTRAGDLAIRIDPGRAAATDAFRDLIVELRAVPPTGDAIETRIALDAHGDCAGEAPAGVRAKARKICELLLPAESLGLAAGAAVILFLRLTLAGESVSFRGIELRRDGAPAPGPARAGSPLSPAGGELRHRLPGRGAPVVSPDRRALRAAPGRARGVPRLGV